MGRDLWLHTGQNWNEAQLQTRFQQGCLILLVDVCGFVEVVRQTHPTGLIAIHQVQQQVHVGQCLDGHRGAVGGCAIDIGVDNRLAIDLGDFEGQLEQVFQAQLVVVGSHKPRQIFLGFFVLVVLLCALAQVKDRQRFAFFVLPGTVDDLVNVLERFLVRGEHDTEACQVRDLTLVDLAVEQRQLMLKTVVVATDVAQGTCDIRDRSATRLAQRKRFVGTVRIGIDQ